MLTILALGFSSGLPAPLVFFNLSLWLKEAGVSRTDIGLFALVATPYAINFLWAPLIDRVRLPWLTRRFGRRRGWALFTQALLMLSIVWMSFTSPSDSLWWMALAALAVTTVSATQDIVIDAYRVDVLERSQYGAGSAMAIWGWHIGGTLIGGAGGLLLADNFGWQVAYQVLAAAVSIGMLAIVLSPEPDRQPGARTLADLARVEAYFQHARVPLLIKPALIWLVAAVVLPFWDFTKRHGWWLILLFVFVFRLGDALQGRMAGVFYRELGFSLTDIAEISKVYGLAANLLGTLIGGILAARLGLLRALVYAGLSAALTNLCFAWLAQVGHDNVVMIVAVVSDGFTGGLVAVAFVAYLSSLCNVAYTATQYALLASLGNLARIWLSAASGYMVDQLHGDWVLFFAATAVVGLIGLPLIWVLAYWETRQAAHPAVTRAD